MAKTWDDMVYMQDMTSDLCASVQINTTKQLIDNRDDKSYTVAKLADKNCWMTQNLGITNKTINSTDSDMTSGSFTIPVSNISGFTTSDQYQSKAYYEAPYGGYYNWYTATAGSGTSTFISGDAPNSICPKNWQLPPSSGNKSYAILFTSYGSYANNTLQYGNQSIIGAPLNFVYGGYAWSSSIRGVDSQGWYWSSTTGGSGFAYNLSFTTSVNLSGGQNRDNGLSVRCVAR